MKKIIRLLSVSLLLLTSCATTKSVYPLNGEWAVVRLGDKAIVPTDRTPYLGFNVNDGQVYGFTGCNRLTGSLNAEKFMKGKVTFGALATTRMLCQDDAYEGEFLATLGQARQTEVSANEIKLKDAAGRVIMVLNKKTVK